MAAKEVTQNKRVVDRTKSCNFFSGKQAVCLGQTVDFNIGVSYVEARHMVLACRTTNESSGEVNRTYERRLEERTQRERERPPHPRFRRDRAN